MIVWQGSLSHCHPTLTRNFGGNWEEHCNLVNLQWRGSSDGNVAILYGRFVAEGLISHGRQDVSLLLHF